MKRCGFKPEFAGAVEAAASTGGQIMPPIMGAAAFIMADNLSTPYIKVALAALIPAVLYYQTIDKTGCHEPNNKRIYPEGKRAYGRTV